MEPSASLLERRIRSARDEIAEIALQLFSRDGFGETTVDAIAAQAGCSTRTFYRYFGSKEDVMFHDLPDVIADLGRVFDAHLESGLDEWSALTESLIEFIARFAADETTAVRRMNLWTTEPALSARYLQYVAQAEQQVLAVLCRHRGTSSQEDDLANLMAQASMGAYRVTVTTHHARGNYSLSEHLRDSLSILGTGLDQRSRPATRQARARRNGVPTTKRR